MLTLPDWRTIRVDEAACEASNERFTSLRCFMGGADAVTGDERLLIRAGDEGTFAEGSLVAKGMVDGRSVFVGQLLHAEGNHDGVLPLLIAFDEVPIDGRYRLARCVALYADGVDDLEAFRRSVVQEKLEGLHKQLEQKKAWAAVLPSTQAQVDRVEGFIQEITAWLTSSGRDPANA